MLHYEDCCPSIRLYRKSRYPGSTSVHLPHCVSVEFSGPRSKVISSKVTQLSTSPGYTYPLNTYWGWILCPAAGFWKVPGSFLTSTGMSCNTVTRVEVLQLNRPCTLARSRSWAASRGALLWLAAALQGNWWWWVGDGRKQQRSQAKRETLPAAVCLLTTSFTSPRGLLVFLLFLFLPLTSTQRREDGNRTMTCVEISKAKNRNPFQPTSLSFLCSGFLFLPSKENNSFSVFYIDSYLPCFFIFLLHVWNSVYKNERCALVRYSMQPNSKFINKIYLKWIFKWDYLVNLPTWIRIADLMRLWHAHIRPLNKRLP